MKPTKKIGSIYALIFALYTTNANAQCSTNPGHEPERQIDRLIEWISDNWQALGELGFMGATGRGFPVDPVTGTIGPAALSPEFHSNMRDAINAQRREGQSGSRNLPSRQGLDWAEQELRAQQRGYAPPNARQPR
jgi:hypothetical protein